LTLLALSLNDVPGIEGKYAAHLYGANLHLTLLLMSFQTTLYHPLYGGHLCRYVARFGFVQYSEYLAGYKYHKK
jgi:hypothetical protein